MTLLEVLVALAIAALLLVALGGVVGQSLQAWTATRERNQLAREARFAMDRMLAAVGGTSRLMIPMPEDPGTAHSESVREVLAVSLDPTLDRDGDGFADADNDQDGRLDEDPPEDLDGDGVIYQMRYRVRPGEEEEGNATLDPRDPTGRLMRTSRGGDVEGEWVVVSEGYDSDGDGRFNEDGIGGLDLHRNYPENWRPAPGLDATGRGYTQRGAGEYPLSEIETRSGSKRSIRSNITGWMAPYSPVLSEEIENWSYPVARTERITVSRTWFGSRSRVGR